MRPRLAVITTIYRPSSHSDVIVSRWLEPHSTDHEFGWPIGGRSEPQTQIASLYIAQFPEIDIGREKAAQYDVPLYATVREALTLGGETLAVDGVILIGEHGDYPTNEWYQKMYPRRELFDEIVAVFRESGRSVPIFNDKHLSYDADSAFHMVETARELNFPLMAGSSLCPAGFLDEWTMPDGVALRESFGTFLRGTDVNGYHSIEWVQSVIARRQNGESGVESVIAYRGESFERALADGLWSRELMDAAYGKSRKHPLERFHEELVHLNYDRKPYPLPAAICFQHCDGMQSVFLASDVEPAEFLLSVMQADGTVHGGSSLLNGKWGNYFCPHFALLCIEIEHFMLTGQAPYPVEHYLLATLMTRAGTRALATPGEKIETPEMVLPYHIP